LTDVAGYPAENSFMIFTKSSDVPEVVNHALEAVAGFSAGMEISELIETISDRLRGDLASGSKSDPVADDSDGEELEFSSEDEDDQYDYGAFPSDDDDLDDLRTHNAKGSSARAYHIGADSAAKLNRRIRADLRTARFAGFKIGIIDGLKAESKTSILSISIQISKLGLSDEVTQAWDLDQQQYIVLLVRYGAGYKTFDAIIAEPASSLDISFRIGVCTRYKPSRPEAVAAFVDPTKSVNSPTIDDSGDTTPFRSLFISNSLNDFLNNLLISLAKIRKHISIGWDGAKLFYNDQQGRTNDASHTTKPEYYVESVPPPNSLPRMMQADHLADTNGISSSFPLIAAQFTMRYLLRCTEFCLVCHDRLTGDFEAMKPYVCSNPLCLYQYMSLGFGPSIEHEIMSQPYVVDLLVSFCYAAAAVSISLGCFLVVY
jgi:ubiquitin-conjugating enzyme E2 Q